jgi:transposase
MKQIRDKVGGLDVHRDGVVACSRIQMPTGQVEVAKERFTTTQAGLAELTAFLVDAGVRTVAMEATGIYWRPVYYALQVNAALHRIALTQARDPGPGRTYLEARMARGDSRKEAMRMLRRRLSDEVFRRLLVDERAAATVPCGDVAVPLAVAA